MEGRGRGGKKPPTGCCSSSLFQDAQQVDGGGRGELLEEARGAVGDAGIQPEKLGAALREVSSFPFFFFPPRYIRTYSADRGKASLNRCCIGCLSGCNALCFLFLFIVSFVSRAQPERSERVVCFRVPRLRFGQEV